MSKEELRSKRWKLTLKGWAERREMIQKAVKSGRKMADVAEEYEISRQRVEQICKMRPPWED